MVLRRPRTTLSRTCATGGRRCLGGGEGTPYHALFSVGVISPEGRLCGEPHRREDRVSPHRPAWTRCQILATLGSLSAAPGRSWSHRFSAGRIVPDGLTSMSFICRSRVTRRGEPGGRLNPRALRALDRASSVTGCPGASSSRSTARISSDGAACGVLADPRCARAAVRTRRLPVLLRRAPPSDARSLGAICLAPTSAR